VTTGRMRFRLGRRTILAGSGESVVVPRGQAHWFGNAGEGVAHAQVEVRPALRMEEFLRTTESIRRSGHFPGTRMPRLSDTALMLIEFSHEVSIPRLPPSVVRLVLSPLAWFAKRRNSRRGSLRRTA